MTKTATHTGAAEYVGTFKQGSPEWHAARYDVVGSSDIAPVLGLAAKSEFTLWCEKVGLVLPAEPDEKLQNKFDYGHWMEPFVAGRFQKKNASLFLQETGSWRNLSDPWAGCNPDRLVYLEDSPADTMTPHSVLEIKTFPSISDWDYPAQAGITQIHGPGCYPSPGYVAQVKWQMYVMGFRDGRLAGYANLSGDYVEFIVDLEPFEADATRTKAHGFWLSVVEARQVLKDAGDGAWEDEDVRAVLQELAPDIDGSEGTYQTLRRLNPSLERGREVEVAEEIAEQYQEAARTLKAADSELTKWKGHLLAHMGTAQYAVFDGKKIASRVAIKDGVPYLKEA